MSKEIENATDQTFDQAVSGSLPALVDFWAPWCGPCQRVGPAVEAVAKSKVGKLKVVKVNVDDCPQTATRFQIMSIPTLIMFKDGKVAEQIVGAVSQSAIEDKIQKYL